MLDTINSSIKNQAREIQEAITTLQKEQEALDYIEKRSQIVSTQLEVALKKIKMDISRVCLSHPRKDFVIGESTIRIGLTLKPSEGNKFRFISFKGYTKDGASKNHKQLVDKSNKFDAKLASHFTEEVRVVSNSYSFEDNATTYSYNRDAENTILVDVCFK